MLTSLRLPLVLVLLAVACSNDESTAPADMGTIIVRVQHSGTSPLGTYRVLLDDTVVAGSVAGDSSSILDVAPGSHGVLLESADLRCVPDRYVAQAVTVVRDSAVEALFAFRCDTTVPGIVFASSRDNNKRNIYRMSPTGADPQRLTTYALGDDHPAVSPGGTLIAFQRQASLGLPQIWVMNADGTEARKLSDSAQVEQAPNWAPDGKHLAFVRWTTGDLRSLIIATPDGRAERTLMEGIVFTPDGPYNPAWSPDGTKILVGVTRSNQAGWAVVSIDGSQRFDYFPADTTISAIPKAWTPEGQILVCRGRLNSWCTLLKLTLGGAEAGIVVDSLHGIDLPQEATYSPDGNQLALTYFGPGAVGSADIVLIPAAGGAVVNLTSTTTGIDLSPTWVP